TAEDNQREIKRLGDTLTEQSAFLKKAQQDRRVHDDALQTALKEFGERIAELEERLQAPVAAAPVAPAPVVPPAAAGTERAPADPGAPPGSPAPAAPAAPAPSPRELYSQAYADYARGNYDLSIQEYKEYLRLYPSTDLSDNAQYWIGECY